MELKQSTTTTVMMLAVDNTDHVTAMTGLTLTLSSSKGGGAFAAITPTVTERGNGWYAIDLTSSHTDTLGDFVVRITNSGAEGERLFSVVANIEADTFARIGAPVGASVSADIASRLATTSYTAPDNTTIGAIAAFVDTEVTAIKAKTDNLPAVPAAASDIPSAVSVASEVRTNLAAELGRIDAPISSRLSTSGYTAPDNASVAAVKAKTDLITTAPATQTALDALLTTALTESYAADGAAPTPAQALCMILQLLSEKQLSGTTMSIKRFDGSTTAMTFTLDSATAPTSMTRAS